MNVVWDPVCIRGVDVNIQMVAIAGRDARLIASAFASTSNNPFLSFSYKYTILHRCLSSSAGLCCLRYPTPRPSLLRMWSSCWTRSARWCSIPIPPKSSWIEVSHRTWSGYPRGLTASPAQAEWTWLSAERCLEDASLYSPVHRLRAPFPAPIL